MPRKRISTVSELRISFDSGTTILGVLKEISGHLDSLVKLEAKKQYEREKYWAEQKEKRSKFFERFN